MLVYSRDQLYDPDRAKRKQEEYLERIRATDFRRSPDLPCYFVHDFFNDGKFARFEYDPHQNALVLQMESVLTLNDVYDLRASLGMPREMPHQCEDFSYTCTFRGVAYLQVRQIPMQRIDAEGTTVAHALPRGGSPDDYQHGEILNSPLLRELEVGLGVPLFHLRVETGWAKQVDVIFEKVVVRKLNDVNYESYTGGKRVRLSHVFRG